jgi:heavy metal-binding protein
VKVLPALAAGLLIGCGDVRAAPQPLPSAREQPAAYMCPMHPDVRGKAGDTCPKCGMTLNGHLLIASADFAAVFHSHPVAEVSADGGPSGPVSTGRDVSLVGAVSARRTRDDGSVHDRDRRSAVIRAGHPERVALRRRT